jgi:hypothetical protein
MSKDLLNRLSRALSEPVCEAVQWKGREATRLANGVVEIICLTGGGHMASLRLLNEDGSHSENLFWEAPWKTQDPVEEWSDRLSLGYGPVEIGRFLASYTGHALCLDYFGAPSKKSVSAGLSLHGEAAITRWNVKPDASSEKASCGWHVRLPVAQLSFKREIRLGERQSVAYLRETVGNETSADHRCDWVQHATMGPPLLQPGESTVIASARRGLTGTSYERHCLLAPQSEFEWPRAPRETLGEWVDLTRPFHLDGYGFLAALQLDPGREQQFVLAANWRLRLGVCYCFRRCDFPWMTVWEENRTRRDSPWNGITMARGMEFGTAPLPLGEQGIIERRGIFGATPGCVIPARGTRTAKYLISIFSIPSHVHSIQDAAAIGDAIILYDRQGETTLSILADGCETFLSSGNSEAGSSRGEDDNRRQL